MISSCIRAVFGWIYHIFLSRTKDRIWSRLWTIPVSPILPTEFRGCWTPFWTPNDKTALHFSIFLTRSCLASKQLEHSSVSSFCSTLTLSVSAFCSLARRTAHVTFSSPGFFFLSSLVLRLGELEGFSISWYSISSRVISIVLDQPNITAFKSLSWMTVLQLIRYKMWDSLCPPWNSEHRFSTPFPLFFLIRFLPQDSTRAALDSACTKGIWISYLIDSRLHIHLVTDFGMISIILFVNLLTDGFCWGWRGWWSVERWQNRHRGSIQLKPKLDRSDLGQFEGSLSQCLGCLQDTSTSSVFFTKAQRRLI